MWIRIDLGQLVSWHSIWIKASLSHEVLVIRLALRALPDTVVVGLLVVTPAVREVAHAGHGVQHLHPRLGWMRILFLTRLLESIYYLLLVWHYFKFLSLDCLNNAHIFHLKKYRQVKRILNFSEISTFELGDNKSKYREILHCCGQFFLFISTWTQRSWNFL